MDRDPARNNKHPRRRQAIAVGLAGTALAATACGAKPVIHQGEPIKRCAIDTAVSRTFNRASPITLAQRSTRGSHALVGEVAITPAMQAQLDGAVVKLVNSAGVAGTAFATTINGHRIYMAAGHLAEGLHTDTIHLQSRHKDKNGDPLTTGITNACYVSREGTKDVGIDQPVAPDVDILVMTAANPSITTSTIPLDTTPPTRSSKFVLTQGFDGRAANSPSTYQMVLTGDGLNPFRGTAFSGIQIDQAGRQPSYVAKKGDSGSPVVEVTSKGKLEAIGALTGGELTPTTVPNLSKFFDLNVAPEVQDSRQFDPTYTTLTYSDLLFKAGEYLTKH